MIDGRACSGVGGPVSARSRRIPRVGSSMRAHSAPVSSFSISMMPHWRSSRAMGPAKTLSRRFGVPAGPRPAAGHVHAQSTPGTEQQTRLSPPRWLRRALAAAGVAAAATAATIAAAPSALSHPSGLRAALAAANTVAPFAVEIDAIQAGWHRPLEVHGIRLYQKKHATLPIKTANLVDVEGETPLVEVQRVRTSATLWQLVRGEGSDVVVRGPLIDLNTLAPNGAPALLQTLQDAGLSPKPRGQLSAPPPLPPAQQGAEEEGESSDDAVSAVVAPAAVMPFSAEVRARGVHVAVSGGSVLAPAELADALGAAGDSTGAPPPNTHVEVLLGAETIEEEARVEEAAAGFTSAGEEGVEESSSLAEWARHKPSVSLPPDVGKLTGPVAIRLDSPAAKATLAGWRTAKGYTYLASPVQAELNLTPAMARLLLRRLNPLLGDAVALRRGARVAAWASPADGLWPSAAAELRVEPLRLRVGRGAGLSRALEVLKIVNAKVAAAANAAELAVDTTPLRAELRADGTIVAHRLDLAVSVPGLSAPLRLVSWGTAAASASGPISMTLALPADSLALVGISVLPPDFGVPLPVRGTVASPRVDVIAAGKEIALLLVEAKAKKAGPRGAEWLWQELCLGGGTSREWFKIPEE